MIHSLIQVIISAKQGENPSITIHAVEQRRQDVSYFITKSWLNDLENIGQVQRSLCMTHLLMLVITCAKYGKNPSRIVDAVEQTWKDVSYFISFITKSWLNDLEDIDQGQGSLHATHPFMLIIICAKYGKNPSIPKILKCFIYVWGSKMQPDPAEWVDLMKKWKSETP